MKQYNKNPRKITPAELEALRQNIVELGDLSGIVHEAQSDEIIGGNQRSKIININKCKIEIVTEFPEPDSQGTIAIGYVIWSGQKLNYRKVIWNEAQRERANITANKLGGSFDLTILKHFNEKDLLKWGFKDEELFNFGIIDKADKLGVLRKYVREVSDVFNLTVIFHKKDKYLMDEFGRKHGKKPIVEFIINEIKKEV